MSRVRLRRVGVPAVVAAVVSGAVLLPWAGYARTTSTTPPVVSVGPTTVAVSGSSVASAERSRLSPMQRAMRDLQERDQGAITPDRLAAQLRANGATQVRVDSEAPSSGGLQSMGTLPLNTFAVHQGWAHWVEHGKTYVAFHGYWDYRGGFIGSGSPYDVAAMKVTGFDQRCWQNISEGVRTTDSEGHATSGWTSKHSDGHASTIWDVNDHTSGFTLKTGHAIAWIEMRRDKAGCDGKKQGKFWHEHNQNGNGSWTAGIDLWVLHINYTGTHNQVLRKSTRLSTFS